MINMQMASHISRDGQTTGDKETSKELLHKILKQHILDPINAPQPSPKEVASAVSGVSFLADSISALLGYEVR